MKGGALRGRDGRDGGKAVPVVLSGAIGAVACLGAIAYAAAPRDATGPGTARQTASAQLPRPVLTERPAKVATSTTARFGFSAGQHALRFQCRLDRREWQACRAEIVFTKLVPGEHSFSVRVLGRRGRHGPATRFRWRLLEPKEFSIVPRLAGLSPLYPGAPPVSLPLTIANPNPVPIRITSLRVAAAADPQGCTSAANLELIHSSASNLRPLRVPAKGSVSLPAPGASAPAIQLRDLPVNQDACQNAQFPLAFSGKARG
jgi:hypothetical protein